MSGLEDLYAKQQQLQQPAQLSRDAQALTDYINSATRGHYEAQDPQALAQTFGQKPIVAGSDVLSQQGSDVQWVPGMHDTPIMVGLSPSYFGGSQANSQNNLDYLSQIGMTGQNVANGAGNLVQRNYDALTGQQNAASNQYINQAQQNVGALQTAAPVTNYGNDIRSLAGPSNLGQSQQQAALSGLASLSAAPSGPSAAQQQLQASTIASQAQDIALARSGRGNGPGGAAQAQGQALAQQAGAQGAMQAHTLAAQEAINNRALQAAAYGAQGQVGAGLQGQAQALTQQQIQQQLAGAQSQLGFEQADLGYAGLQQNEQQNQLAALSNQQKMAQQSAGVQANAGMTAAQQAYSNQIAAAGMQQAQLATEAQERVIANNAQQGTLAGVQIGNAQIAQQNSAAWQNAIGTGAITVAKAVT